MKRLFLALGLGAAAMAISTPASAQSGCKWYDVNCRIATGDVRNGDVRTGDILNGRRVDGSWQLIGRDGNGNGIYQRRRVDGNGNVVIERARRDARGRMVIIDRDVTNRTNRNNRNVSRRYEKNGMICTYKQNSQGYHEKCRYAKNKSGGLYRIDRDDDDDDDDDRYRGNRNRVNRNDVYRNGVYRNGVYRTNRVSGDKYERARGKSDKYRRNGRGRGDD